MTPLQEKKHEKNRKNSQLISVAISQHHFTHIHAPMKSAQEGAMHFSETNLKNRLMSDSSEKAWSKIDILGQNIPW